MGHGGHEGQARRPQTREGTRRHLRAHAKISYFDIDMLNFFSLNHRLLLVIFNTQVHSKPVLSLQPPETNLNTLFISILVTWSVYLHGWFAHHASIRCTRIFSRASQIARYPSQPYGKPTTYILDSNQVKTYKVMVSGSIWHCLYCVLLDRVYHGQCYPNALCHAFEIDSRQACSWTSRNRRKVHETCLWCTYQ